ncbi:hypothetical protein L3081_09590 [Colwellia sp. MSW7]|uniref:Uncharacterized protein n=1 Tax=Colwellia maritima TaxID=2912588 RepID=A0ABS9X050_9GAMM|nr:hypothetical protein [Colwellia maritima]MCI2283598.1 hypothetical protein [Colwellia maritima]
MAIYNTRDWWMSCEVCHSTGSVRTISLQHFILTYPFQLSSLISLVILLNETCTEFHLFACLLVSLVGALYSFLVSCVIGSSVTSTNASCGWLFNN